MGPRELKRWLHKCFVQNYTAELESMGVRVPSEMKFVTVEQLTSIGMPPIHRERVLATFAAEFSVESTAISQIPSVTGASDAISAGVGTGRRAAVAEELTGDNVRKRSRSETASEVDSSD
eukprot:IDg20411t1